MVLFTVALIGMSISGNPYVNFYHLGLTEYVDDSSVKRYLPWLVTSSIVAALLVLLVRIIGSKSYFNRVKNSCKIFN